MIITPLKRNRDRDLLSKQASKNNINSTFAQFQFSVPLSEHFHFIDPTGWQNVNLLLFFPVAVSQDIYPRSYMTSH